MLPPISPYQKALANKDRRSRLRFVEPSDVAAKDGVTFARGARIHTGAHPSARNKRDSNSTTIDPSDG